ncbi:PAS domain S-box protein [Haloarchaeobius iranensis]|uniref:histidine kinase n=1 Tax=Haloarchaeobius iranensis TaxID=996166 RepID=A0A1H0BJN1_9EURY|nr:PAS domain S-box protein [Haloarchaeobius iranensis]SDN45849.1 PAS domain S-box-containing protein [Haloarchaeobius iranensis]
MTTDSGGDSHRFVYPDSEPIDLIHVDDDPQFATLVSTFLERQGDRFRIQTETDPEAALSTIRDDATDFDCVVSDYDMPGLDGLELLEQLRTDYPDLPFILFTGHGSEAIASEAITAGVTEYLQKGGGTEQYTVLANRVEQVVERYWAERYADHARQAIETAQGGINILDKDGYIQYVNEACAELLGYEREELLGEHWEILYREEDIKGVYDVLLPEARQGQWQGQTTYKRKDASVIETNHTLTVSGDGSLICTFSPVDDPATERELSLRTRAMDEAPVGIVLIDPHTDGNPITYANDRFTELSGYDSADVMGRDWLFLEGPETSDEAVAELRSAIQERQRATVELRNYRADGTVFWDRVRVAPVFDSDGELARFVGFHDDVTEGKTAEEQLRSSRARLEALFEGSPDMIILHDAEGVIQDVNPETCRKLGYTQSELVGQTVWDIDATADRDRAISFWDGLETNCPRRFEAELRRSNGGTIPVEVHLIRLDLDGEDRFVAMDRDITEQRARKDELLQQNERLDRFASVVSHDLRNPLQLAQGRLELLSDECKSEHTDDIEYALNRMDDLVENLLTLAQLGDEAMEIEQVALSAVVRNCWETVDTREATLVVETERSVDADPDQLQQLFENLVRNSVEHGGMDVTVTVGDTDTGFYVADDGPGIPESEREKVFEAGYSTADAGTGFGLDIVEEIVAAHDWTVQLTESAEGGARFDIQTDTE